MKDLGDASFVLGIQIHRDRSRGILGLSQRTYIDKVLQRYGMQNSKPGDTPVAKGDKFSLNQCPKNSLESQEMQKIPYASAVGSLMYAQVCTRSDIAYIVGMLGRYLSNPGMDHWRAAKRVMRYLQRTKEYMLTYRRLDQLELIGYSDSDFARCQDSRRSTSGYIYLLAGGAISWRSAKQTLVTSSTMEVEFVACYEASNQGIWLRNFVTGLRVLDGIERPLKIFCDNKSAVLYSNNNRSSTKSKYIDIKFLVVKEKVQSGQISIEHIGTNSMIADPLTKGITTQDKVDDLAEAAKSVHTLESLLDSDIRKNCEKDSNSHSRNLVRVKRSVDMLKIMFEQILARGYGHVWGNSIVGPVSTAYKQVFAPYHGWLIRTGVSAAMITLPTKAQLLRNLNEDEATANVQMQKYVTASASVLQYIDKLFHSRRSGNELLGMV
ncbi:Retrovirus-related Pol polyprotein from transposon TNT 1-94 [Vitis vinifera]|uniref:Retrovirus-related Pol polyprotein from transposon TNT 1-94 n=1 Tax=Vitis vinifera TaxID=29760 RepID=A0A438GUQ8_VITVI|nr:Retrovirus-related Pol polyprotein from transposon TNT 1-94 [Vitis vinifera]